MNLQPAPAIGNKACIPEPVHEQADTQLGCARHAGQILLTDFGDPILGRTFLAETGK